ncbi:MAG: MmgE/PrpD family protein, partial [Spirochaetota bacterium]
MTGTGQRSAEIAEWATGLVLAELSPTVLAAARRLLVDRLGVGLGGSRLLPPHPTLKLAETMRGIPSATVLSSGKAAFAPYAVLANGCAGDSLELGAGPDCVEAALAAAEVADASLGELLAALVVAAEISGYLRRALGLGLEEGGLHPPAALGSLPAAAAVGRLLGFDAETLGKAITAAASLTPMSPYGVFSSGAPSKTLYGGYPQFLGYWSCLFAERGVGGPATILEGRKGLAQAIAVDLEMPPFEAPSGYEIEKVLFKAFGACRACHP